MVVIGLNLQNGENTFDVSEVFEDGEHVRDAYSGKEEVVENGRVRFNSDFEVVLLERV